MPLHESIALSVPGSVDRRTLITRPDPPLPAPGRGVVVVHDATGNWFQPEAMDMETAFMKLTEGKTA